MENEIAEIDVRVERVFKEAKIAINKISSDGGLHDLSELTNEAGLLGISTILSLVGAIRTTQGTSKVYFEEIDVDKVEDEIDSLKAVIKDLIGSLRNSIDKSVKKTEVVSILEQHKFTESDYYQIVSLLSQNNIATSAGKGRMGGIQLYEEDQQTEEIEKAVKEIQEETGEGKERKETEREDVLYPSASKLVSDLGYQAVVLGVVRRLRGEWNTPDLIGYKINKLSVLGGAEVEVISVEVKWSISKYAIAEANSHQKSVNKSYLMVYQELEKIDEIYLSEMLEKGIGLICLKSGKPVIHSAAKITNALKIDVDGFLSNALDKEAVNSIKDEIAKSIYNDTLGRLLPQSA